MEKSVTIFAKPPQFALFCVRSLCFVVFFISLSIKSEPPFHDPDSVIFVSEGSYVFNVSQDGIYTEAQIPLKQRAPEKQEYKRRRKVSVAASLPPACKKPAHQIKAVMACASPQSPQYIGSSGNALSTAVLGSSFQPTKHHKIAALVFMAFLIVSLSKRELQYLYNEPFPLMKMTMSHFSRPPPWV